MTVEELIEQLKTMPPDATVQLAVDFGVDRTAEVDGVCFDIPSGEVHILEDYV